ncbi:hypothetical protein [Candidatus Ferrigenium straubiae]|uniref:hypothetical protein n=1 Tax=Candidatus Ferrigenium straubiae TaxID=2919506 RepID=UPI003F4AB948
MQSLYSPLSKQPGFYPDFPPDCFLEATGLQATDIHPVNILRFRPMAKAGNSKLFLFGSMVAGLRGTMARQA